MDRERFLQELEEIKKGCKALNSVDGGGLCNRIYSTLVECLAHESKNVEAKLQVLTSALCFYVDLRPHYDIMSPEADAFGHYLFMECSRLVLGIEFHHLKNDDVFKCTFKSAISDVYRKLQDYAIGQVFLVLEWLMVNQWSHPTLVAMMKGEDIDKDRALTYIRSGEYPELFRLRVEMLMESGCDNFASNLVNWCIQSPLFENDVPLRSTHLLLLHKLGRNEQLHGQCCQLSCCIAKEILRHLMSRSEEPSFLLLMTQTFLLLNWIKPGDFCCTKELLEFWLTVQHQGEPERDKFLDSVNKVVVLTQDIRQITIFLEVMVELFESKFIQFCTELALTCLRKEQHRLDVARDCQKNEKEMEEAVRSLIRICLLVARLYLHHPQMHLACLLTVLYLEPNSINFFTVQSYFQDLADIPPVEAHLPVSVDPNHYRAVLEIVELLRPSEFHPKFGWKDLKILALNHLEGAGYRYDLEKNVIVPIMNRNQPGREPFCLRIKSGKPSPCKRNDITSDHGVVHENALDGFCGDTGVHGLGMTREGNTNNAQQMPVPFQFTLPSHIQESSHTLNELKLLNSVKDNGDKWLSNGDEPASVTYHASVASQKPVAIVDDSVIAIYHQQQVSTGPYSLDSVMNFSQLAGHSTVTNKMHAGFTLDDIQQVLSATQTSCDGSAASGMDIPVDERKLREITAFLLGRHPDGMTFAAGVYSSPLMTCSSAAIHASGGTSDATSSATCGTMHQSNVALPGATCASTTLFSTMDSVLPHGSQAEDMQFDIPTSFSSSSCSFSSSLTSCSSSSSTLASSQKETFDIAKVTGHSALVIPPSAFSSPANCLGSTILVTESNLPYLQQFLPNLQTVMQSVQSLVRGVPSQTDSTDKSNSQLTASADNSTSSSDLLQEVPNIAISSFGSIPPLDSSCLHNHLSPNKIVQPVTTSMTPVNSCSVAVSIGVEKGENLPARVQNALQDSFSVKEGLPRSKEKCKPSMKETDSDKFYCRFCRRGFATMAQRRRHVEWMCQKKKAAQPASQPNYCLKCDLCGKTFVSKSGHTTHMMRVHTEQKSHELILGSDTVTSTVRLPEDVTLRDCFVKIVRMDNGSDSDSKEGSQLERIAKMFEGQKVNDEAKDEASKKEETCMCDSCGVILSSFDKLNVHLEHCKITLPLERNVSSERLRNEFPENCQCKEHDALSIISVNGAGPTLGYSGSSRGKNVVQEGLPSHFMVAERNTYVVQNQEQLSALTMPGSTSVKQGAVFEMLQLAEHFLKHSPFVAHSTLVPKVLERLPEAVFQPKMESELLSDTFTRSHLISPVVTNPISSKLLTTESKHLSAEINHMTLTGMFSHRPGKRIVTVNPTELPEAPHSAGFLWPKSGPNKTLSGSVCQSGVKPDVLMDSCLSVGKEILYEGTKMHEYVEYQCETCLLTFNESASANAHIEGSDHSNSCVASYHVYVCTSCCIKYRDKQVMRNHILYICTGSSSSLLTSGLQKKLHRCNLCTKAFISNEFLQVHLSLKHGAKSKVFIPNRDWLLSKITFPMCADLLANQAKEGSPSVLAETTCTSDVVTSNSTVTFWKPQWSASNIGSHMVADVISQPHPFATPSAVSIPTLEQLTSSFGKVAGGTKDLMKFSDLASSHQTPEKPGPGGPGGGSVSVPDILTSIPEDGDVQKQGAATSTDIRQLIGVGTLAANVKQRSSKAKGILYKNVFMQCEGAYFCSVCKADLSTRESKKTHRQMPCGDPRTITYSRKYSYLCPYCMERFPSQKTCRQHQVSECLPLIGISTEELSVKELICPLCPKKYFNLIPLKGHMTQVHKLPKAETREMLHRLGYMELNVADDQGKVSQIDGCIIPERIIEQNKLSSGDFVSGDQTSSTEVEFVQQSMLFDFENDVSSECAVQGQDVLIQNSCDQCPEMEVIYDGEIFKDQEDKKLENDDVNLAGTEEMEINSGMLGTEATRLGSYNGTEKNASLGMDQYLSRWPDETAQLSEPTVAKSQNLLEELVADSTVSPEQRRRKPRQTNEFFVMMFRNYPILAKGVSVCVACQAQMSSNIEVDNHISSALCTGPDGRPADVKRSTIFKCTHCDKTFWKAKTCRQHQLDTCLPLHGIEVDNLVQPSVACPLCAAKSYNRSGLMSHMKYKHGMDTKGVRDIMEQYGIHKKTADLLPPSHSSNNCVVGSCGATAATIRIDDVQDSAVNVEFQKPMSHLDLDSNEKLYTCENVSGMHFVGSENAQPTCVVSESCPAQFTIKGCVAGKQFEVQRLYTGIGALNKDQDHGNTVATTFNCVT